MPVIKHCFVVPAHGHSPYLGECLDSLRAQTRESPIIVSTSTPFEGLEAIARSRGATLAIHPPGSGIGADWNAALASARADWVTIAHQDDLYERDYVAAMLRAVEPAPDALMAMAFGHEIRGGVRSATTPLMTAKRLLTELAFLGRQQISGERAKRRLLAFGNPVICPSVMLNMARLGSFAFREDLRSNLDWCAWLALAGRPGAFVLVRQALVAQRTHAAGETTRLITQGVRRAEDELLFAMQWPAPVARLIAGVYRIGYLNRRDARRADDR